MARPQQVMGSMPDRSADPDVLRDDETVRALQLLPPRMRAVLVLRLFEDCTEAETAAVLGCPVATVVREESRAVARMQELLAAVPIEREAGLR
jgi:DNA-directed RNA polymerase specialized sigma24 family protein